MLFIPGWLIGILTFPGIIAHELGHLLLCRLAGVEVKGWCLFRLKTPQGFVMHEKTESVFKNFLITFGPFLVNTALTVLLTLFFMLVKNTFPLDVIFLWLAFSVGAHAFPSTGDGRNLWNATVESIKKRRVWNAVFLPFVAFIYIGALLSFFWIDFIYASFLFFGTQTVLSAPIEFSGNGMSHKFENNVFSFNYPWSMQQTTGEEYLEIKTGLEEQGFELYFLNLQATTAAVVFGGETDLNADYLETAGMVTKLLEYNAETDSIQKSELVEVNGKEWYEINNIDSEDPGTKLHIIEGITFCQKHKVYVKVLGSKFNHALFGQITSSFKCKGAMRE